MPLLRLLFLCGILPILAHAQDPTTDIKWGEARYGLRLGWPIETVANTNYPTAAEALQPLVIKVHNPTDSPQFYLGGGRFAGLDFHFLTPEGSDRSESITVANPRSGTPTLFELAPGETKTIEIEVPSRELKHFDYPLLASIDLYDKAQQKTYRVFSPPVKFLVTD